MPLGHFRSFFEVLAFCSHFLKASGIRRLISFQLGQWYKIVPLRDRILPGPRRAKSTPSCLLLLPSVSSIFNLSVGAITTACAVHALAGTRPILKNCLTPTFMLHFWKALFFSMSENLTVHFFLLAWSFAPNLSTLVLQSTPSVSTLVTPSSLLPSRNSSSK